MPAEAQRSLGSFEEARVKIGRRQSKNTICACFCCDRFDGSKQPLKGTFIPHLSTSYDGDQSVDRAAPMRMVGDGEEWAKRFDKTVADLAGIVAQYKDPALVRPATEDSAGSSSSRADTSQK